MNQQRTFAPLLGAGATLGSLFVVASVLLGQGNHLALLFRYLLVGGFVAGLFFPRGTLMTWLVLCGYTDMLKRLMVVFGNVQHSDLFYVLGIPPMMIVGAALSVLIGACTRRHPFRPEHWRLFGIACVLVFLSGVMAALDQGGSMSAIVAAVANDGTYAMLLFVIPALFRDTDDLLKLVKLLLYSFLPVAVYGVFQQMHGFQEFEIAYLKTGLTMEIKQLYANEVRAFSTMNSPTAFSVVSGMLCALSLFLAFIPARDGIGTLLKKKTAAMFGVLYFAGMIASTSRSSILLVVLAFLGFLCFQSSTTTRWLYWSLGVAFVAFVALAGAILSNLDTMQDKVSDAAGGGQLASQLSRVGTFSDRLRGFSNLMTNPEVYTLFGYGPGRGTDETDPLYGHDMISNTLVAYGLVPLLTMAIIGGLVLIRIHRGIFHLHDRHHRLLASGLLALTMSLFVLSAVSGSVLGTFPINALLWLCFALLALVHQSDLLTSSSAAPIAAPDHADAQPVVARRPLPFRRSGYPAQGGNG